MKMDLHIHTCYSDGELTPNEIINLAKENNLSTIAITDHDTISGLKDLTLDETNIKVIPGIELSAKVDHGRMHILGYNIDVNNIELNNKLNELRDNSLNSVLSIIEQIKCDYNIVFGYEDIKELINANKNLGRPEIAKLCLKNGYANSVDEAFEKYLNPAYQKVRKRNKGLSYPECIKLIINSGGIPVLAHPKSLKISEYELCILVEDMMKLGLQGIEVYHSSHSKEEMNLYLQIANKYNLLISGGSDFHGKTVKPEVNIGTGINNNLSITNLSILEKPNKKR